jgi:hypothetical protein
VDKNFFTELGAFLMVERQETERWLTDFSAPWRHTTDNWQVPPDQVREYHALERNEQKQETGFTVAGVTAWIDEHGNMTMAQAHNRILVRAEDRSAFLAALMTLPTSSPHPGGPVGLGVVNPGQSSSSHVPEVKYDERPQVRAAQEMNERRMQFAADNQARYQEALGRKQQQERTRRLREELEG